MAWIFLVVAGLFEIVMALSLKLSDGFSHVWWSVSFFVTAVLSFGLLSYALKSLDVGTAYAVWTGIGAVGTAVVGILAMGDNASFVRIASIALIVVGIVGLNLAGAH